MKPSPWMPFVLSFARLVLLLAFVVVALLPATADAGGVLLRLRADRDLTGEVFVDLVPPGDSPVSVQLRDDGRNPDVSAGDGLWSGALSLPYAQVEVSLVLGDRRFEGGTVSWSSSTVPRDIDLALQGSRLKASGREANTHGDGVGQEPMGAGGGPAAPVASSGGPAAAAASASAESEPSAEFGDSGLWFLGGGALVLALFMVGLARRRGPARGPRGGLQGVILHPAGGFAGADSPPLNDGLVYWTVEPQDRSAAVTVLARMLSRHHNVVLVGDDVPVVSGEAGRGLYRMASAVPAEVGDVMEALHRMPLRPAVVLFSGVDGAVEDWNARDQELPHGAGGIVLRAPDQAGPPTTHQVRLESPGCLCVVSVDGGVEFTVTDRSAA